jgi:hypothetical protein
MKNYRFPHTADKLPKGCGIGWLLNDKIKDLATQGTTQNLLDFYSMKYRRIPQVSSYEFVKLCEEALHAGFTSMLMLKQGIVMQADFIERTKPYWNNQYKDCVIVGHVLDRTNEEAWWQIHPQAMYLDLKWWEEAGKPEFGDRNDTENLYTATKIERSDKTFGGNHGETYNPDWIKATEEKVEAKYTRTGWKLLDAALSMNKKVGIWDQHLRDAKEYCYGEMEDHYEKLYLIGNETWVSRWYAANTENLDTEINPMHTSSVFSTCGGLSPISNAYIQNLKTGGDLICFDADPLALQMCWYVFQNWDGTNWKQFVNTYISDNPMWKQYFAATDYLDGMDLYLEELGQPFVDWWRKEAQSFNVKFERIDVMRVNRMKAVLDQAVQKCGPDEKVFIDVSNAFNYEVNSVIYSKNVRLACEADYINWMDGFNTKIKYKGFDINKSNTDPNLPWMPKLFPWQAI